LKYSNIVNKCVLNLISYGFVTKNNAAKSYTFEIAQRKCIMLWFSTVSGCEYSKNTIKCGVYLNATESSESIIYTSSYVESSDSWSFRTNYAALNPRRICSDVSATEQLRIIRERRRGGKISATFLRARTRVTSRKTIVIIHGVK